MAGRTVGWISGRMSYTITKGWIVLIVFSFQISSFIRTETSYFLIVSSSQIPFRCVWQLFEFVPDKGLVTLTFRLTVSTASIYCTTERRWRGDRERKKKRKTTKQLCIFVRIFFFWQSCTQKHTDCQQTRAHTGVYLKWLIAELFCRTKYLRKEVQLLKALFPLSQKKIK